MSIDYKIISREIDKLVETASFSLRPDVAALLKNAYSKEPNLRAKKALGWIIDNSKEAKNNHIALCQDTGFPVLFIDAGKDAIINQRLISALTSSVAKAYQKLYLRPSIVHPLARKNPSYKGVTYHIDFSSRIKGFKITLFPKGFGSENKSRLKMFSPTASLDAIEDFVVDSVSKAGPESCPPFVVGVGIGGTSDSALLLAKKSLLGRLNKENSDKVLNKMEQRLLKRINALKIGPMGLGGKCSALAVKIKTAPTHIAGLPAAVNISCHALRSASLSLNFKAGGLVNTGAK
ncbi:MAG: fumarate hydratase [Candidatus Omnitrophota bacterium]